MTYSAATWKTFGKTVQESRTVQNISINTLAYVAHSSAKSIMRIEQGRVFATRADAPPADYNSENYVLKRLGLIEMALGWQRGSALTVLEHLQTASMKKPARRKSTRTA